MPHCIGHPAQIDSICTGTGIGEVRTTDQASEVIGESTLRPGSRCFLGFPIGCLIPVAVLLAFIAWCAFLVVRGPRIGEHVPAAKAPIRGLPKEATDVCYLVRAPFWPNTAYEFTISEEGFRNWAKGRGWELEEIGEEPATIHRYAFFAPIDGVAGQAHVTDGLWYGWRDPQNIDFGRAAVFDRQDMRAYYFLHTR